MEEDYKKLCSYGKVVEPDTNLEKKIMARICLAERREVYKKAWSFGVVTTAAFALTITSSIYLYNAFLQSGFYQYLSLIFSGDTAIYTYWKELSVSLFETLPILGTIAFLVALTFLVWSGANAFTNSRRLILQY